MNTKKLGLLAVFVMALAPAAHAHTGAGVVHSFMDGLLHPLLGIDHLLVMLAIGLWAMLRGGRSLWLLPSSFLLAMAAGAGLHFAGMTLAGAEIGVALSVLAVGVLVWRNVRIATGLAALLVAIFALGHGYVHAAELTNNANAFHYAGGFLLTTAILHLAGLLLGLVTLKHHRCRIGFAVVCTLVGTALLAGV